MEGNLRFKIHRASAIVGRKFTVFALFYFVFEGNFQLQASRGVGGGGAYISGAYFRNFTVRFCCPTSSTVSFSLCMRK